MAAVTEYGEKTFDDISDIGDNTNRIDDVMAIPSIGKTSIVRYKVPDNYEAVVNCIGIACDYGKLLLSGAYTTAQNGALIRVRFDTVVKFEQKFNWCGLQGYIGGADDYNAENEVMLSCYDQKVDASTVIDIYITGSTNVRRMIYIELYGTLDDGTLVNVATKQAVDETTATAITAYTVPVGRILTLNQIVVTTRHIDLYAGKGYLVYNGLPVMVIDICQTEVGGAYNLVFPFYDLPLKESASIGIRIDSYECGNELVAASVYSTETAITGGTGVTCFAY